MPIVRLSPGEEKRTARKGPPGDTTMAGTTAAPMPEAANCSTESISPPSNANVGSKPACRHAASVTEGLSFLLAHRPGFAAPPVAARK